MHDTGILTTITRKSEHIHRIQWLRLNTSRVTCNEADESPSPCAGKERTAGPDATFSPPSYHLRFILQPSLSSSSSPTFKQRNFTETSTISPLSNPRIQDQSIRSEGKLLSRCHHTTSYRLTPRTSRVLCPDRSRTSSPSVSVVLTSLTLPTASSIEGTYSCCCSPP